MNRLLCAVALLGSVAACHTVPDPYDPARQQRIDACLQRCGSGEPGRANTAYPPAPSELSDIRTPCERLCHGTP